MEKPTFDLEKKFLKEGRYDFIAGIDEAGRGPLAGPVVACVAVLRSLPFQKGESDMWDLIRDSKTLSEKQREKAFDFIQENFYIGIGLCDHKTIDRINILEASFLAMKKAVSQILRIMDQELGIKDKDDQNLMILLDGNREIPNFSHSQRAIIQGDKKVKSISAASIIAKVTRDRIMLEMHEKFPDYGFDKNKGYGTKLHVESLKEFGPCEIHRQSFAPVKSWSMEHGA
ncbi:MAG: ribonuclease HII [Candidatus Moranbacteria bacterium]|nr:ribonuclease HII [Candidatus Moranbacteria bacterium]MDD5652073.1 ribonuclease HII [Candidatus Moranbacteria bacterium]